MKKPAEIGREMFLLNTFEDYEFDVILSVLEASDTLYHNDNEPFLEDNEYDALRLYAERLNPGHVYFTGVGSDVRGGKIKLPFEMGSLDQVEIGDFTDWVGNWSLQKEMLVLSDKMDGTSALVIYNENGDPQIAYSRGNGTEGADISRHIFKIHNVPKKVSGAMQLRAEVELTESAFKALHDAGIRQRSGKPYKNARNMVAGLMNSKSRPAVVYEHLTLVTYQVLGNYQLSKVEQLALLKEEGFQVVGYSLRKGTELNDNILSDLLNGRRDDLDYAIDGLVIDVNSAKKRTDMNPTRDTLNPAYSIKYKVADASNHAVATVKSVTWNISKHGFLKPQVNFVPFDLVGVTISNTSGFNAKFIYENGIGPGATVNMTRAGDVVPFLQSVVTKAIPQMPGSMNPAEIDWNWEWNETGVDAVLIDAADFEEVTIQQAIDFFTSIEAPHLKEGNVRSMFEQHDYTDAGHAILSMLNYDQSHWVSCIGANGVKIFNGLRNKMDNIDLYVLAGSTHFFGRGVGKRKFKKLFAGLRLHVMAEMPLLSKSQIISVDGFEDKTASKIIRGIEPFMSFAESINNLTLAEFSVSEGGAMEGEKVAFTGFRNAELQAQVESEGGTMQSAVSGKTTILVAKNPNSTSGKMKKARNNGTRIMGVEEFKEMMG